MLSDYLRTKDESVGGRQCDRIRSVDDAVVEMERHGRHRGEVVPASGVEKPEAASVRWHGRRTGASGGRRLFDTWGVVM